MAGELVVKTIFSIANKQPFASPGTNPESVVDDIVRYMNPDSGDNTVMYGGAKVTIRIAYIDSGNGEVGNPKKDDFTLDTPMRVDLFGASLLEHVTKLHTVFFADTKNQHSGQSKNTSTALMVVHAQVPPESSDAVYKQAVRKHTGHC